uniref:Uncharacterized protein n=1 Tax=Rhizophora mucronata TaxID=61149 RepID=A0A2P2PC53_RHIMU
MPFMYWFTRHTLVNFPYAFWYAIVIIPLSFQKFSKLYYHSKFLLPV